MTNTYPYFCLKIGEEEYVNFISNRAFTLEWLHFCIRALGEEHGYTDLIGSRAYQDTRQYCRYERSNNPNGLLSSEAAFLALINTHCAAVYDEILDRGDHGYYGHHLLNQTTHEAIIREGAVAWPEHVDAAILHITSQRVILWWTDDEQIQYLTDPEELGYVMEELPRLAELKGNQARSSWFSPVEEHFMPQQIEARALERCAVCRTRNSYGSVVMECGHCFHRECIKRFLVGDVETEGNVHRIGTCPVCPARLCQDNAMPGDEGDE